MKVNFLCGKETINLELPDSVQLIENKPAKALADPASAVRDALLYPIGTAPLKEIAQGRKNVCIVISDITRPVPNKIILPPLIHTLEESGIAAENINHYGSLRLLGSLITWLIVLFL